MFFDRMKYIKTSLGRLSSVGFGCMQTNNPDIIKEASKNGVNLFVTAEAYGDVNQMLVATALSDIISKPFIATKVGIDFTGRNAEEQFTQSRVQIRSSVKKCMNLLGKNPLDLVALHRLDAIHQLTINGNNVFAWEIALDELINLQKEGVIQHIGLSEPTAEQLKQAINITKARGTCIASVESAYSIVTRRAEVNGVKELCDNENITLIAYSSVIRGLTDIRLQAISLTDFDLPADKFQQKVFQVLGISGDFVRENLDMLSTEHIKHNIKNILQFQSIASKYAISPAQLALAWVQHKKAIPIPGTGSMEHMLENTQSAYKVSTLEKTEVFSELDKFFPPGTFHGDPNPITIAGALDSNSKALNLTKGDGVSEGFTMK